MGTLIQVIFREGTPKPRSAMAPRASYSRNGSIARERSLKLWREREDLVMAVAYRGRPAEVKPAEKEVWNLRPAR
jgi:hypothetical protein